MLLAGSSIERELLLIDTCSVTKPAGCLLVMPRERTGPGDHRGVSLRTCTQLVSLQQLVSQPVRPIAALNAKEGISSLSDHVQPARHTLVG